MSNRYKGLTKGDERALAALNRKALPPGIRATKAMRFTLPTALADRLEAMTKAERDELMRAALEH